MMGWDDLVFTHITAKIPGEGHHFLINPTASCSRKLPPRWSKIDLAGNKLDDNPYPINPAGFVIHSAIHAARDDAKCVLHTHSLNGVAVSAQKGGVLPISQQSIFVLANLAYHSYEGVALMDDEKPRLVADLGTKNFFMLRNHGFVDGGTHHSDAFQLMYIFEGSPHDSGSRAGGWRVNTHSAVDHRQRGSPVAAGHPWPGRAIVVARCAASPSAPHARIRQPGSRELSERSIRRHSIKIDTNQEDAGVGQCQSVGVIHGHRPVA